MSELVLQSVRIPAQTDTGSTSVYCRDGVIVAIGTDIVAPDAVVEDCAGALLLPGFVDAHCHVDKTLWGGPWVTNTAGPSLPELIANERRRRAELRLPSVGHVAALLGQMVMQGTSHVRTHTTVDPEIGLAGIETVSEAASRHTGRVSVEQVAFPQFGMLVLPGTVDLMNEAAAAGVQYIGGIDPAGYDRDPIRHLDAIFAIADRHGCGVDVHLHDPGELGAWEVELIIERTNVLGLAGKVTISHAFGLCEVNPDRQSQLAEALAEADITVATAAVYSRPVPPLKALRRAGVNVACGNDGIRDLWAPYGNGDMLERAMHLAYRSGFRTDEDIELVLTAATHGGARTMRLDDYGIHVGAPADLVVVNARTPAEAVVTHPERRLVVKHGSIVSRNSHLQ